MNARRRSLVLSGLMLVGVGLSEALRPRRALAGADAPLDLETVIPRRFGSWQFDVGHGQGLIGAATQEPEGRVYTRVLARTYANVADGGRVMLSIAYSRELRDATSPHLPDLCYPSQGFRILTAEAGRLGSGAASIPVRRLDTIQGNRREPLTYWTMVGDKAVLGSLDSKLARLSYSVRGDIPDGLVFRVSSISNDTGAAFGIQAQFVAALLEALPPGSRRRLAGLAVAG